MLCQKLCRLFCLSVFSLIFICQASAVRASDALSGQKTIYFIDQEGGAHAGGTVTFTPQGEKVHYELVLDDKKFEVFFLSMKEMKCLEGPELWCNLPYPWHRPQTVTADDLSWLSHDLLFMFKLKTEFATNFWNGIYYDMRVENGIIKGVGQSVDLNLLALKPDDINIPPLDESERDTLYSKKRWLPAIEIR